jgi:hypothetical protein
MSESVITKGFYLGCHVMAGITSDVFPSSTRVGLLFETAGDQDAWVSKFFSDLGGIWFESAGFFSGFNGTGQNGTLYQSVSGGHARVKIGYPSAGGHVSNLDFSESGTNKYAFGKLSYSDATASTQGVYFAARTQGGDVPFGSTTRITVRSGPNGTITTNPTFQTIEGELYSTWALDADLDELYTVYEGPYAPNTGPNLGFVGSPQSGSTMTWSGSFDHPPQNYFTEHA